MASSLFNKASFSFLQELEQNNSRDWFQENRPRYEEAVRQPALAFIESIADDLANLSPHFLALPKKVGGSLMRVHRDTRFSRDKTPYKTNIGIQFRHEVGKDVHAPGYYLHIEPDDCFLGVGIWRPDSLTLGKIRDAIVLRPEAWQQAVSDKGFKKSYLLSGESLKNAPRGYDKEHPLLEDLKRKDFIAIKQIRDKTVLSKNFQQSVIEQYSLATPYMQFLCRALDIRF